MINNDSVSQFNAVDTTRVWKVPTVNNLPHSQGNF